MLLLSDSDGFCSENFVRDEVAWVTDNCVKILWQLNIGDMLCAVIGRGLWSGADCQATDANGVGYGHRSSR